MTTEAGKDWLDDSDLNEPGIKADQRDADQSITVGADAVKGLFDKKTGLRGPANRKRLRAYIAVGVLLIGSLLWMFFSGAPKPPGGSAGTVERVSRQHDGDGAGDRVVQESIITYNENRLPEIQETENPYAHPLLLNEVDEQEVVNPFTQEPVVERVEVVEQPQVQVVQVEQSVPNEGQNAMMDDLLVSLLQAESDRPGLLATSWNYRTASSGGSAGAGSQVQDDDDVEDDSGATVCRYKSVRAGDELFATANLAMNSDVGGEVSFTIRSGPLNGYKVLGEFERREKWLRIVLNRIVARDTVEPISAIALDMDTSLNAVSGKVNRHLIYRYGWWGFGSILSAVGRAAELGATKEVYTSDGVIVENMRTTTNKELRIALGELGKELGSQAQDRINRPITVTLKRGEQVGIFVLDDICVQ